MRILEPLSKISSAPVGDMRAATSSNFAKKSSVYLNGYTSGFFARFPRLASHLANLATKLFLRPVLLSTLLTLLLISSFIALSPLPAAAQTAPPIGEGYEAVPTSPKEPWGEFKPIQENEGTPWWTHLALWLPNRVLDLIDIFRIDVGVGPAVGGVVRVTEYAQAGYRQMLPASVRIGDFGRQLPVVVETSNELGVSPLFIESKQRSSCPGQIGVGADILLVGAYGGVCLDEAVDFLAGLFFVDLKDDDM